MVPAVASDVQVLRPNGKATSFRLGVDAIFAIIAAALVFFVTYVGAFTVGTVAIAVVAAVFLLRALHAHWKEWRELKHVFYQLDGDGLSVVNERSGQKEIYRAGRIHDVEVFKVPFGYGVELYRNGERRDHWKRVLGARLYLGAEDYSVGGEEKGLLALHSSEEADQVKACLGRASLAAASLT